MVPVLDLKIGSSNVTAAVKELDRLSAATLKAEAALAKMGKVSGSTDNATRDLVQSFQEQGRAGQSVDASYAKLGNRLQFIVKAQQNAAEATGENTLAIAALGMGEADLPALPSAIALRSGVFPLPSFPVPLPRPINAPSMPASFRDAASRAAAGGNAAIARAGDANGNPAANGSGEASQSPFQKASRTLAERSKVLETEGRVVGLGTAEREAILEFEKALNALKLERNDLSAEDLRKLREQASAVGEVAAQTERAKDAQAQKMELEGAGRDALKGILLAPTAKNPIDALVSSLDRFRQKLLDMAANELLDTLFGKKGKSAGLLGNGLLGSLGSLFGLGGGGAPAMSPFDLYAKGGVFAPGGLHAFALGGAFTNGIVHRPTLFPFANGIGLMGEAGPEAIMPLRRDSAGRLGVGAAFAANSNGRPVQVTVNNNAGAMVTESHDGQGNVTFDIDRLADQVDARSAARIAGRNSPVGNAMAGTYGLQQKPVVG